MRSSTAIEFVRRGLSIPGATGGGRRAWPGRTAGAAGVPWPNAGSVAASSKDGNSPLIAGIIAENRRDGESPKPERLAKRWMDGGIGLLDNDADRAFGGGR